ncbi:uncharacterized protein RCO7_14157 [Rhynchosporium graminicola]|uniref:Uncharacterized protein n=1 Tax=Rhynchosporium graminicola TaxID=2792576 RepID=A0A1E1JZA9_9HELO|nr:uncharacterized protein RCO7_14157 [Rhynchosporium commune]
MPTGQLQQTLCPSPRVPPAKPDAQNPNPANAQESEPSTSNASCPPLPGITIQIVE